jgi:hypothetical protein
MQPKDIADQQVQRVAAKRFIIQPTVYMHNSGLQSNQVVDERKWTRKKPEGNGKRWLVFGSSPFLGFRI